MQYTKPAIRHILNLGLVMFCFVQGTATAQVHGQTILVGSGASFPAPLVREMAAHYSTYTSSRVTVEYSSIGSGAGIRQFLGQEVMFGMTEAFLPDDAMAAVEARTGGKAFNMPFTLADVVPTYNIPGVKSGVVLSGEVLAQIFMGSITSWSDGRIKRLNPTLPLPNLGITVIHRSDASGTTNILTNFLSSVSADWEENVGKGTLVNWLTGRPAMGNEGVAQLVMETPGSIGYNSFAHALLNGMSYGSVINKAGNAIEPSLAATTEAANIDLPPDTRILFTNTTAQKGYPIAGFTWMLVYQNLDRNKAIQSREEAVEVINFLVWAITQGQELSEMLGYARIPRVAVKRNFEMIGQLMWKGEPIGRMVIENRYGSLLYHELSGY